MQNAYENANDDAGNGASAEAFANIDVALWIVRQQVLETTSFNNNHIISTTTTTTTTMYNARNVGLGA
jgi:methanogenic corrinoid protein MtbC1